MAWTKKKESDSEEPKKAAASPEKSAPGKDKAPQGYQPVRDPITIGDFEGLMTRLFAEYRILQWGAELSTAARNAEKVLVEHDGILKQLKEDIAKLESEKDAKIAEEKLAQAERAKKAEDELNQQLAKRKTDLEQAEHNVQVARQAAATAAQEQRAEITAEKERARQALAQSTEELKLAHAELKNVQAETARIRLAGDAMRERDEADHAEAQRSLEQLKAQIAEIRQRVAGLDE